MTNTNSARLLHPHTRSHPEGGSNSGEHGDNDVENLPPDAFVFHSLFDFSGHQ